MAVPPGARDKMSCGCHPLSGCQGHHPAPTSRPLSTQTLGSFDAWHCQDCLAGTHGPKPTPTPESHAHTYPGHHVLVSTHTTTLIHTPDGDTPRTTPRG